MPKMVSAVTPGKSSKAPNGLCRSDAERSELLESLLPDIVELMLLPPELLAPLVASEVPPAELANGLLLPAGAPPTAPPLLPPAKGLLPALDPLLSELDPSLELEELP